MIKVGMLSHRKHPTSVFKAYAFAAVAKLEDVLFYFFSPSQVDFNKKEIRGWIYEDGEWCEKTFPFPDVIYNASSPKTEKQRKIIRKLEDYVPFTSHPIGDKLEVYRKIYDARVFSDYLIPTFKVTNEKSIFSLLSHTSSIVLKPINGSRGRDIFFIKKVDKTYIIFDRTKHVEYTESLLLQLLNEMIQKRNYLCQPFIQSFTKNHSTYSIRLHVQKARRGEWELTTIFPTISDNSFVANLHQSGTTMDINEFLKLEFQDDYYNVKRYLERFALMFSKHFDTLYPYPLDELGIDIALDANKKIWIYEVNWRPGTPPLLSLELDVARQKILYAKYIVENSKKFRSKC
ncbi:YheC/YheD family endospore coat-associated protein [Bacillus weihaiensis]|uniref:YheC/YheD family endospore coat-associated protein n=1 Tax=Bacillus weihaiensis TaxID=1547283 RepID=UPI002357DA07|nr:YheC/YheD family protein [Bacillus weihaiensis]